MSNSDTAVNEKLRRVISKDGAEIKLSNVTAINNTGAWDRIVCDQGYVIINRDNVLAYIIKGDRVI